MDHSDPGQSATENPLLHLDGLPQFSAIRAEHVEPAVRSVLESQRRALEQLEQSNGLSFDWALDVERLHEAVHRVWEPVSHLNAVLSTPHLRAAYNECLPLITEFNTEVGQNEILYSRFRQLSQELDPGADDAKGQLLAHALRDFRLAGVALSGEAKERFSTIMQELARRQANFEQNLMDATDAFRHHTEERDSLAGLPDAVVDRAEKAALEENLSGWLLSLDPPTYSAVMTHAESRELRELYYRAWVTRASDQGPHAGRWDNRSLIEEIVSFRHEAARALDFDSYAELSLATKMAGSPQEVMEFLRDLAARSRPVAQSELADLERYAGRKLAAWDVAFYAERVKQDRFELADDELRPYFPLPTVQRGLFQVVEALFGLKITPRAGIDVWHPDVKFYDVLGPDGAAVGSFFTDLFARPNKRGGAWMDDCLVRARLDGFTQQPVAHLVCNFNPPVGEDPSLLTHHEVVTLFHEFGHALHHLLTEVDYPSLSGINGVAWDAVELPSQFLENYAWLPEVLPWISGHHKTGEPLPKEKLQTLNASRTFNAGLAMVRQLEFALFDFRLHAEYDPNEGSRAEEVLARVRSEVAVIEPPSYNRFANSFSHIFGGHYAAGYYSYKWAEVLAADAFSSFEEQGSFDPRTAERFRRSILAVGGTRDALDAFVDFRGRKPILEPLLRQSGIEPAPTTSPA